MFTGLPHSLTDAQVIGRLLAAGLIDRRKSGLETTPRWEGDMSRALAEHPGGDLRAVLRDAIHDCFPDAAGDELEVMAKIMLFVEARKAGLHMPGTA